MRDAARFLRHTSISLYTDAVTQKKCVVENSVYVDGETVWIVCVRDDGTISHHDIPFAEYVAWRSFLFPNGSPGTRASPPTGDLAALPDLSEGRRIMREKQQERRQRTESLAAD